MKLATEIIALIKGPVAIAVASRDADHFPSLCHAYGCRWDVKEQTLRIFVLTDEARPVLSNIAANGEVAAVFSDVRTLRSLQIKGRNAHTLVFDTKDARQQESHYRQTSEGLLAAGYPNGPAQGYFDVPVKAGLVTLAFTPADIYQQTPGPHAGDRLPGGRLHDNGIGPVGTGAPVMAT